MKKDVYRVLGHYLPEAKTATANYWVSAGSSEKELPTGFDPTDIAEYANKILEESETLDNGLVILKITQTIPADAVLRKTVANNV